METNSDDSIGTLPNPLSNDIIINILNVTSRSAKLIHIIILFFLFSFFKLISIFVFFNLVGQGVRLFHMSRLILILLLFLYMLLNIILSFSKNNFFSFTWLSNSNIGSRWCQSLSLIRIDYSSCLSILKLSVILNLLRSNNLWLTLDVWILVGLRSLSCPVIYGTCHGHDGILVSAKGLLGEAVLWFYGVDQVRFTLEHLLNICHSLPIHFKLIRHVLLRYLSSIHITGCGGSFVGLYVVDLDVSIVDYLKGLLVIARLIILILNFNRRLLRIICHIDIRFNKLLIVISIA